MTKNHRYTVKVEGRHEITVDAPSKEEARHLAQQSLAEIGVKVPLSALRAIEQKENPRYEVSPPTTRRSRAWGLEVDADSADEARRKGQALIQEKYGEQWSLGDLHVREVPKVNPTNPGPRGERSAKRSFEEFHARDARALERFAREIKVPEVLPRLGPAVHVTYRSDKWNDGTHDYIHKIESFPKVVLCASGPGAAELGVEAEYVTVPKKIRDAETLSQIGLRALGAAYKNALGKTVEITFASGTEWFWSPHAKALYAIKDRSRLVALLWGGRLDVEPRGIVG